jgi:succinate-semialdehyde dehydrogenase/glutarate-semialdehyde dehydrogenase
MPSVSVNPYSGETVSRYDDHSEAEVDRRLELAASAFEHWRSVSFEDRGRLLVSAAELLEGELPSLAEVLTKEMGKTFASAKGEVSKCALTLRYYAQHGQSMLEEQLLDSSASRSSVRYEPLGPVLAVMPWNFPLWQVIRFAAPALMAGNVAVLKHASNVPEAALALESLFRRAGFPEGCFVNLFIPSGRVASVIRDERIVAVTLTGSEAAGISVASAAGSVLKKCVLELGGSDPFIVAGSADLDRAVPQAILGRVQNNGQSCIAAKRFIVVDPLAEQFIERFATGMRELVVGDPMQPATDVGPLVSAVQRDEVAGQVVDALAKGAVALAGGQCLEGAGFFYQPTVLTGVTQEMRAGVEELFGPVAVVFQAGDLDEAIALANSSAWGLGSSIWAEDPEEQEAGIRGLEAGMVFVNAIVASTPELPFGGVKRSGYGRELSAIGIREFCNAKSVFVA